MGESASLASRLSSSKRRPRGKRFDPVNWNEAPAGNPFPQPEALRFWQFPRVKRFVGIRFSSSKRFPFGTGLNKPFPPNEALQFLSLGMAKRFAKSPRPEALQSGTKASAPSAIRLPGEKRFPRAGDQKCFPPNEAFPPFGFKNPPAEALQSKNEESASSAIQLLGRKRFPLLTLKKTWSKRLGLRKRFLETKRFNLATGKYVVGNLASGREALRFLQLLRMKRSPFLLRVKRFSL